MVRKARFFSGIFFTNSAAVHEVSVFFVVVLTVLLVDREVVCVVVAVAGVSDVVSVVGVKAAAEVAGVIVECSR